MRKQCVDASLSLRRVKDQLSLSVLQQYGVVVIHCHRTVGVPVRRRSDLEHRVVQTIRQSRHSDHGQNRSYEQSSQPYSEAWLGGLIHEARL